MTLPGGSDTCAAAKPMLTSAQAMQSAALSQEEVVGLCASREGRSTREGSGDYLQGSAIQVCDGEGHATQRFMEGDLLQQAKGCQKPQPFALERQQV